LRLPLPATHCVPVPALRESPPRVNFVCTEPESSSAVQRSGEEPLVCELSQEWQRALAGDGQARANWQIVEGGGGWSWQENAICARNNGSEWSAYQYSRCDPQVLRALKNFVVEVTLSGSAQAAGVSFGPYKDFLTELDPQMGPRRVQLEVDVVGDTWAFRVDGRLADRHWWDSAVRSTADLVSGNLTFKVRGVRCALFQDLAIHTFLRSCEFSVITTCYRFAQRLRISLRNWVYQNLSSGTHEILVVNPNSPDGTHELLAAISSSYPHVRVREVPVASSLATYKGAMINRALELSRGRWIWLTDADCLFPPTCGDAVLLKIAGRTQRVFYGERRHLSAAQTNAVLSGRLDGLSQFDLLARSIPPRPAENVPWGYTQIMERATLDLVRYREDLNHFAHSDSQFIEDCKRRGIVPEQVEGLFCLQLDHPLGLYGSHTFL